jgi:hypothetical protein
MLMFEVICCFGRLGVGHCLSGGEETVIWFWGGIFLGLLSR